MVRAREADVDRAVQAAHRAFNDGAWAEAPRGCFLRRADIIAAHGEGALPAEVANRLLGAALDVLDLDMEKARATTVAKTRPSISPLLGHCLHCKA